MTELSPIIRNTARAVIVRESHILLLRKSGQPRGEWYALPGGGQETGESLVEALERECLEEIGSAVGVGRLAHVAEFCKRRDTQPPSKRHLVEFFFHCHVPDDYRPQNGPKPDKHQVEVVWMKLEALPSCKIYPQYLATCLPASGSRDQDFYLGVFQDHAAS